MRHIELLVLCCKVLYGQCDIPVITWIRQGSDQMSNKKGNCSKRDEYNDAGCHYNRLEKKSCKYLKEATKVYDMRIVIIIKKWQLLGLT